MLSFSLVHIWRGHLKWCSKPCFAWNSVATWLRNVDVRTVRSQVCMCISISSCESMACKSMWWLDVRIVHPSTEKKRNTPRAPLDLCEVPACTKDLWGCWGYRRQCYAIIKNLDLLKIRFALHKITIEWPRSIIWAIWKYDLFLEAPNQQVASYDGAFPRTKPQTIGLFCFINLFCFRTESNLSNRTGVFV